MFELIAPRDACRIQTCDLLIRSQMLYSAELRRQVNRDEPGVMLLGRLYTLCLLDASLLSSEVAEVEDTSPADLTDLVDLNVLDER